MSRKAKRIEVDYFFYIIGHNNDNFKKKEFKTDNYHFFGVTDSINDISKNIIDKIDFIPLKEESLDLVVSKENLHDAVFAYILRLLKDVDFQEEIRHLKGYNIVGMGDRLY